MSQDLLVHEEEDGSVSRLAQGLPFKSSLTECEQCKRLEESRDYLWDKIQQCLRILHDMDNPHGSYRRDTSGFAKEVDELLQT